MFSGGIREPEFAGELYPQDAEELAAYFNRLMHDFLGDDEIPLNVQGAILPHDSPLFCGETQARLYAEISVPERVLILHPRTALPGKGAAFSHHTGIRTPFGDARVATDLLKALADAGLATCIDELQDSEHAAEVVIPFLQASRHGVEIAALGVGPLEPDEVAKLGDGIAEILNAGDPSRTLILALCNFNVAADSRSVEKADDIALEAIEAFDAQGLLHACKEHKLTLTGAPAVAVALHACKVLGCSDATVVDHADSGETSGVGEDITGYASVYLL